MKLILISFLTIIVSITSMTQDLVLSGGNVIDVRTGDIKIASIHIRDGIIRAISSSLAQPSDATVLDVTAEGHG